MRNRRWISYGAGAVLVLGMRLASADPILLQGEVLEKGTGDPILGAAIYVVDNDSLNATSDERGRFTLSLPTAGKYSLGAVAVGFESEKSIPLTTSATIRAPLKIYLRRDVTLPPVVIRAERNAERVSKTVMTGAELRQIPGAGGDPIKALQTLPGVAMGDDASGEPAIRGSSPEDNVDSFNLYPAAFGPEYDDVTGAVIDVALRKPRTDRPGGKVNVSLIGADALIEGPITLHQSALFSVRRSYFDLLLGTIEDQDKGEKIVIPRYYDYQGKYIWEVNDTNILTVNMNGASDSMGFTLTDNPENETKHEPYLIGSSSFKQSYDTQAITWSRRLSTTAVNKMHVGHMRQRESSSIGTAGTIDVTFDTLFLRDELRFEPVANHGVSVGGNYAKLQVEPDLDILDLPCDQFTGYCDYTSGTRKQYTTDFPVHSQLLFAKDRWRITPDFTLIGGLHWTRDDYLDSTYTEPRLGAEWVWSPRTLSPRTLFTAGWGRYNQFPEGGKVIDLFGNPNLERLRATHSVLGVTQQLDASWSVKLEGYYKTFDDLVTTDPNVNYINGASGTARGTELLLKKESVMRWSGWLSMTYSQSRRRVDATGETIPLSFDQPLITTGVLRYKPSAN
ncbi:MAG: putative TonB-dependent receptor, partial [Halothiobacillaceae bacterium]